MTSTLVCARCGLKFQTSSCDIPVRGMYCPDCSFELGLESRWFLVECSPEDPEAERINGKYYHWIKVWKNDQNPT